MHQLPRQYASLLDGLEKLERGELVEFSDEDAEMLGAFNDQTINEADFLEYASSQLGSDGLPAFTSELEVQHASE